MQRNEIVAGWQQQQQHAWQQQVVGTQRKTCMHVHGMGMSKQTAAE